MNEFTKVEQFFSTVLPDLQQDTDPEIKTRITEINTIIRKVRSE